MTRVTPLLGGRHSRRLYLRLASPGAPHEEVQASRSKVKGGDESSQPAPREETLGSKETTKGEEEGL